MYFSGRKNKKRNTEKFILRKVVDINSDVTTSFYGGNCTQKFENGQFNRWW